MELTFYGVRGSVPTPGAEYVKYGGNTACVHIELNDGTDTVSYTHLTLPTTPYV